MQCRRLSIEIKFCYGDRQSDAFAVRAGASCRGLRGHFADGRATEEVPRADQVVGEIHVFGVFGQEGHAAGGVAVEGLAEETHGCCGGGVGVVGVECGWDEGGGLEAKDY